MRQWRKPNRLRHWYNYTIINCLLTIFVHNYYVQPIYYTDVSKCFESLTDWSIPLKRDGCRLMLRQNKTLILVAGVGILQNVWWHSQTAAMKIHFTVFELILLISHTKKYLELKTCPKLYMCAGTFWDMNNQCNYEVFVFIDCRFVFTYILCGVDW